MADIVDAETRSRMMSAIRGKDTRPELLVRRALHAAGLRYRLHVKGLPGRPDIVFPRYRAIVFVHGCFWHRHDGCRFATVPQTRAEFWQEKFDSNIARDQRNQNELIEAGWKVGVIWECSIKGSVLDEIAIALASWLRQSDKLLEL